MKNKFVKYKDAADDNMSSVLIDKGFRVTVKAGGKSRSVVVTFCVVYDDGKNKRRVGIGFASAKNFVDARNQAIKDAQKSLIPVFVNQNNTLYHDVSASYHGSDVRIFHSKAGIKASPAVCKVFKLLKLNATCKIITGSKNTLNVLRAVLSALKTHESINDIAKRMGVSRDVILNRKMCVFKKSDDKVIEKMNDTDRAMINDSVEVK